MTFSAVSINSAHTVTDGDDNDDFLQSLTGATLQVSDGGTDVFAFPNTDNASTATGHAFKPVTDSTFASASLLTGELKTFASLAFGTNQLGSAFIPLGVRNGAASAQAMFADSFTTYSGSTPFLWTTGTTAHFSFNIEGSTSVSPGIVEPTARGPGHPINEVLTTMSFSAYRSGGLDLYMQLSEFDFDAYPDFDTALAAYIVLSDQLRALEVTNRFWYLGDPLTAFAIDPSLVVPMQNGVPTNLNFDFTPGGDFDWILSTRSGIFIDASLQNVGATIDYSHTITANYTAPDGATTYSASGFFPNTLSLSSIPTTPVPVPEPATGTLLLIGLAALGLASHRRRQLRAHP